MYFQALGSGRVGSPGVTAGFCSEDARFFGCRAHPLGSVYSSQDIGNCTCIHLYIYTYCNVCFCICIYV